MAILPPLNALRAFDAAARLGNLSRAAEELFVTHGAVSKQVQQLEEVLGCKLFIRLPRGLRLTGEGHILANATRDAFAELRFAVDQIKAKRGQDIVTISTVPSIAARWLVPRLQKFHDSSPGIEVRVSTGIALANFERDGVDVAIRQGQGNWQGVLSERIFSGQVQPVCSPSLLEGPNALRTPADLKEITLIHDTTKSMWDAWLKMVGENPSEFGRSIILEDSNVQLQSAIEGQGVALAFEVLVQADIAAGRLVKPFDATIKGEWSTYLVYTSESLSREPVTTFINWLRAEGKTT